MDLDLCKTTRVQDSYIFTHSLILHTYKVVRITLAINGHTSLDSILSCGHDQQVQPVGRASLGSGTNFPSLFTTNHLYMFI